MKKPFMYSFPRNCVALVLISTFMCLWAICIFPGSVDIFPARRKMQIDCGNIKITHRPWLRKLGLWPRNSFSGNICFEFLVFILYSAVLTVLEFAVHITQFTWTRLGLSLRSFSLTWCRNCEELFADARANAGVLFASIPNFTEFYSEDINEGVECIRHVWGEEASIRRHLEYAYTYTDTKYN